LTTAGNFLSFTLRVKQRKLRCGTAWAQYYDVAVPYAQKASVPTLAAIDFGQLFAVQQVK
jgi:hypothetical protein